MKNHKALFLLFIILISSSFISIKKEEPLCLNAKLIEKALGEVAPNLYASKYELNNLFYLEFLEDLKSRKNNRAFKKANFKNEKWGDALGGKGKGIQENYFYDSKYHDYPVVNVTQEGAGLFCEWLTFKYNKIKKRKYKNVVFRLPTEEEWKLAARAGTPDAPLPWRGFFMRDNQGMFMANCTMLLESSLRGVKETGEIIIDYGALKFPDNGAVRFTAPVKMYSPNDFGLHQMGGNVAEMLAENGRTKGGSWREYPYYLQIDADDPYEGFTEASPMIGFRYFMEIIEE